MPTYSYADPVVRAADDETPILFEWPTADATVTGEVAFDNVTFTALTGTITDISNDLPRFKLAYNSADRLTSAGIITYKFTDGTTTIYLELRITAPSCPETIDVSTLSSLIETVGPRRVKTKDMEIENHPIDKMQKIIERNSTKPVGLGQIRGDIVSPKGNHWCN
jgi:hypothetical protein